MNALKPMLKPALLVSLTAIATAGFIAWPDAGAQPPPAPVAVAQSDPAPELVSGLPDFTRLVDRVAPGVVSVQARIAPRQAMGGMQDGDAMAEIFHRFGMPMPPGFQGPRGAMPQAPRGISMGTGFLISTDGYVLTNHHVVDNADEVTVRLGDRRELKAKVVGSDAQSDVALLKIDATGLPALRIGGSTQVRPGQWVVAIGSPYGLDHSVSAGIVSATGRNTGQQYVPFIQTDVAINQGNSGGPLLNTRGEVVGINSQIFSVSGGFQGISFAIPIDTAMNAVQQLKANGKVSRGMLGVNMNPGIDADLARSLKLPDTRGALVSDVSPGSGADKAGVQAGDVIRSFNGAPVDEFGDLAPMVGALPPGTRVKLGIWRDGRERDFDVVLGEAPTESSASRFGRQGPESPRQAPPESTGGKLGLRIMDLDADDRRQLELAPGEGVGVAGVDSREAREAGIVAGAVILSVDRKPVGSTAALRTVLASVKPGDTVMLRLAGIPGRSSPRFVALKAAD